MIRITVKMKKLPQILVALLLVLTPAAQGKPVSSETQSRSTSNEGAGSESAEFSNTKLDTPVSEHKIAGHDNLLSDLAKISKDEETNVGNRQTIVGTEVSAATVKNGDSDTRTLVTGAPTESTTTSYFTTPGTTGKVTDANNDMSLVRLSEPTHIVLGKSKDEGNPFSKLITSNEHTPEQDGAKSNDAVSKPQGLSPLISERTESTPSEGSQIKDSAITGPVGAATPATTLDSTVTPVDSTGTTLDSTGTKSKQESNDNGDANNVQTSVDENSALKVHDDEAKSPEKESKNVDKEVQDAPTDNVLVCAGEKQTISCPGDGTLNISSADYGFDSNSICPIDSSSVSSPSCQAKGVYPVIRSACQGQASCLLQSDGQEFGGMCPGQSNFLKVGYSCQNVAPSSSAVYADYSPPPVSPQLSASPYAYQTSPYIPHPISTQPATYYNYGNNNAYTQPKSNGYTGGYMNDNSPGKTNYPSYGNYGNQGYYNYYNSPSQGLPSQNMRDYNGYKPMLPSRNPSARPWQSPRPNPAARPWQSPRPNPAARPWQSPRPNPAARPWQSPRSNTAARPRQAPHSNPAARPWQSPRPNPAARPWQSPRPNPAPRSRQAPRLQSPIYNYANLANTQYQDNRYPQHNYNDYYNQRYSPLPLRPTYPVSQYPRNSYTGSCYACQNCQQCSEQAYCQGCPKCKILPCEKKRPKEERYLDPIDSLVEEFGKKTKGMTPMEMSAVVISPAPKVPEIAHSSPLRPPPKPLEEDDDDDDDDDSDENEFTLSEEDESNNREIEDHESSLTQKKTSVSSSSKTSEHSAKDKSSKKKAEKSKKKAEKSKKSDIKKHKKHNYNHDNVSSLFKKQIKDAHDDDDDEDGYDSKIKKKIKKKKPKRSKINRHKSSRRKSRKHLSKRWFDEDENLAETTGENRFDLYQSEDRPVDSPYIYGTMFW